MKLCLLDFLLCLKCGRELSIYSFESEEKSNRAVFVHYCEFWCAAKEKPLKEMLPDIEECQVCQRKEIKDGLLFCASCQSFYPIINFIPEIIPEYLRHEETEKQFFMKYASELKALPIDPLIILEKGFDKKDEESARFKKAELSLTKREDLPEGFLNPGYELPFEKLHPVRSVERILRFMVAVYHLDLRRDDLVLDLGAGFAWTTEWLQKLGFRPIGLDLNRDYLEIGLQRMGVKKGFPPLLVVDAENLPFRPQTFHGAIFFDSFHHIAGRKKTLKNISIILKPGGRLIMAEPGAGHEQHPRSQEVEKIYGILERGVTLKEIEELIVDSDFIPSALERRAGKEEKENGNRTIDRTPDSNLFSRLLRSLIHSLSSGVSKFLNLYLNELIKEERKYSQKSSLNSLDLLLFLSRNDIHELITKTGFFPLKAGKTEKSFLSLLNLKKSLIFLLQKLISYRINLPLDAASNIKKFPYGFGEVEILLLKKKGERHYDSRCPDLLQAHFTAPEASYNLPAQKTGKIWLSISNSGNTRWLSRTRDGVGEVKIGANLLIKDRRKMKECFLLVPLPQDVMPGESISLELDLPPISSEGEYVLEFDLLAQGVMWFKDCFPNPFSISLQVKKI